MLKVIGYAPGLSGPFVHIDIRCSRHPHPVGFAIEQKAPADLDAGGVLITYGLPIDEHAGRAVAIEFDPVRFRGGRAAHVILAHSHSELFRLMT